MVLAVSGVLLAGEASPASALTVVPGDTEIDVSCGSNGCAAIPGGDAELGDETVEAYLADLGPGGVFELRDDEHQITIAEAIDDPEGLGMLRLTSGTQLVHFGADVTRDHSEGADHAGIEVSQGFVEMGADVSITTSGDQRYEGVITHPTPLYVQTFTSTAGSLDFNEGFLGGRPVLNAPGDTVIGGTALVTNLETDAPGTTVIDATEVDAEEGLEFNDQVELSAADPHVTADGSIVFAGPVDGAVAGQNSLRIDGSMPVTFGDSVGATPLRALTVESSERVRFTGGAASTVAVTEGASINPDPGHGPIELAGGDVEIEAGDLVELGEVRSEGAGLSVASPDGKQIQGSVGTDAQPVGFLESRGAGATSLMGSVTSAGRQNYGTAPVLLGADVDLVAQTGEITANAVDGGVSSHVIAGRGEIAGEITGTSASFVKRGPGALVLSGESSQFAGAFDVAEGTLTVTGQLSSASTKATGSSALAGTGRLGEVDMAESATLRPGLSPGTIAVGNLSLAPTATFEVEIDGPGPGQFDQVALLGPGNLGGANLALSGSHVPVAGERFVIVDNQHDAPVEGTFAGLPEGAVVNFNGARLQISYQGGEGNDVVLEALAVPVDPPAPPGPPPPVSPASGPPPAIPLTPLGPSPSGSGTRPSRGPVPRVAVNTRVIAIDRLGRGRLVLSCPRVAGGCLVSGSAIARLQGITGGKRVARLRNRRIRSGGRLVVPVRFGPALARRLQAAGTCRPSGTVRVTSRSRTGRRAVTRRAIRFVLAGCPRREPAFTG